MVEFKEYGSGIDDEEEGKGQEALTEQIEEVRTQCAHILEDPEISEKLEELLAEAEEFYDVDPAGWQKHLKETKDKLLRAEDDTVAIKDILRAAKTKSSLELIS